MSRDMNEFIRIIKMPIGNVLQMIVFFYCENYERSFRFTWYHPSNGTCESEIRLLSEKICGVATDESRNGTESNRSRRAPS